MKTSQLGIYFPDGYQLSVVDFTSLIASGSDKEGQ